MSDYSVCPEGGFWEEADRPTLSDAIHDARQALSHWKAVRVGALALADALEALLPLAEEADRKLKEYR